MPVEKEFRLKLVESRRGAAAKRERPRSTRARTETTTKAAVAALKKTPGAETIIDRVPKLAVVDAWSQVAYFSVCAKSGTATFLDLWDADHFDGFTDLQRCLNDCRAWFSGDGLTTWGSGQTKTGRINCYFRAPATGTYVCNARLQSYPSTSLAIVECLIDNSSFGPLPFTGTIDQPHPCSLAAGSHHFRIRQMQGAFFFLSLTVFRV